MTTEDLRDSEAGEISRLFQFLDLKVSKISDFTGIQANAAESVNRHPKLNLIRRTLRRALRANTKTVPNVMREDLTRENRLEFNDMVKEDAVNHLKRIGKPSSFWNLDP